MRFVRLEPGMQVEPHHEVIFSATDIPVWAKSSRSVLGYLADVGMVLEHEGKLYRWAVSPAVSSGMAYIFFTGDWDGPVEPIVEPTMAPAVSDLRSADQRERYWPVLPTHGGDGPALPRITD